MNSQGLPWHEWQLSMLVIWSTQNGLPAAQQSGDCPFQESQFIWTPPGSWSALRGLLLCSLSYLTDSQQSLLLPLGREETRDSGIFDGLSKQLFWVVYFLALGVPLQGRMFATQQLPSCTDYLMGTAKATKPGQLVDKDPAKLSCIITVLAVFSLLVFISACYMLLIFVQLWVIELTRNFLWVIYACSQEYSF